ncbi:hypothetical protein PF005_g26381 [Phytophthora fragariae]|uniref:Uncharacterized protein n=1 Tax=Phytophthora fragariae TaxID=53985 RepID=A0A6A3ETL0_9STRA|nr:hypothetical protein PF003_g21035 [Phytophthora fragariae]KAE8935646.1 hypothetical protein PF009_g14413 [Phytophthora fragariae]KAE8987379.1 hypothetical protein PF011_g19598 [Phytophthora fragariae]KAE9080352.1 hypothetical protein PF010_g22413 [Phytophthora fragariae]KAE9087394.1 hypothetical protein PF006_g25814 [Phytophthora fragariae]
MSDKVTSAPKAEASSRDADSAAENKAPQVFDVSYLEFLDSRKAGELAEVVLLRPEGSSLEINSSSVMDPEVLEDERTSKRDLSYRNPYTRA